MPLGNDLSFKNLGQHLSDEEIVNLILNNKEAAKGALSQLEDSGPQYPSDPVVFCDKILGIKLWAKQVEIAKSVIENRNTVVCASKGVGKCKIYNDYVMLANGELVKAHTLINKHFRIMGYDHSDWSMRPMDAYAEDNGLQDVYEIELQHGRKISFTGNHPLLLWDGWKRIDKIQPNDKIAIPVGLKNTEKENVSKYSDNKIKLLAYLLTEGSLSAKPAIGFSQNKGAVLDEFREICKEMDCKLVRVRDTCTYRIVSSGSEYKNGKQWRINNILEWSRNQGIHETTSFTKSIPSWVYSLPKDKIALFINRMFACDGWICKRPISPKSGKRGREIGYCSASEELIFGLSALLLQLGIYMPARKKYNKEFDTYSWSIELRTAKYVQKFFDVIGYIIDKEEQSKDAHEWAKSQTQRYSPTFDLLEKDAWNSIPKMIGKYARSIEKKNVSLQRTQHCSPSRRWIQKFKEKYDIDLFNKWADSDIGWITVKSIKYLGKQSTVAICVPETSAYVSDVIEHNTYLVAALTCWWMSIHPDGKVVTLAPSAAHVNNVLWQDIRGMGRGANLPGEILDTPKWKFSGVEDVKASKIAVGLSTHKTSEEDVTSLHGYHSKHLLVIMDEAAGMSGMIWKAARGLPTSPENRLVAIGNPIINAGPFWDACQSANWNYIHISALESPNVVARKEVVDGLTSYEWVKETLDDHCTLTEPHTPRAFEFEGVWYMPDGYFEAQVLGIAPWETEDQTIARQWVRNAHIIEVESDAEEIVLGLDPSRGGDDPALVARQGLNILWVKRKVIYSNNPSKELAQWCWDEMKRLDATTLYIEAPGVGGGVIDYCREMGVPVLSIYPSGAPMEKQRFANLRAEYYWTLREQLKQEKMHLPDDDMLEADLTAQRHSWDNLARIKLDSKEEIKKRLGRSPDSSDALAITFAYGVNANSANVGREGISETAGIKSRWYSDRRTTTSGRNTSSRWRKFSR